MDFSNPIVLLGLAAGALFALMTVVAYPRFWFFALIASYPLIMAARVGAEGESTIMASPAKFAGFIALSGVAVDFLRRRRLPRMSWWLTILAIVMTGGYILSAAATFSSFEHWLLRMFSTIVFFVLIDYWGQTPDDLRMIKKALVWAVALSSIWAFIDGAYISPQVHTGPYRYGGTFINPNGAAEYLLIAFGMCLSLLLEYFNKKDSLRIWTYGAISLLLVAFLFSTGSRGGFFGFAAFLGVVLALAWRDLRGRLLVPLVALLGVVALGAAAPQVFQERITQDLLKSTPKAARSIDTLEQRLNQIRVSTEIFLEHPITGAGPGNVRTAIGRKLEMHFSVHNRFFEAVASAGLLGVVPYLALLLLAFWWVFQAYRRPVSSMGLVAGIDIGLLAGLVVSSMSQTTVFEKSVSLVLGIAGVHRNIWMNLRAQALNGTGATSEPEAQPQEETLQQRTLRQYKNL